MPIFESRVELPASPEAVFDFISRPANLAAISPPEAGLVFTQAPEVLSEGAAMVCKLQAYGLVQELQQKITKFDPPRSFREELIKGPVKKYIHDYIVEPTPGGAVLINRIDFEPPGGLMGMMVTADRIMDQLEDGFAYRRDLLKKAFA